MIWQPALYLKPWAGLSLPLSTADWHFFAPPLQRPPPASNIISDNIRPDHSWETIISFSPAAIYFFPPLVTKYFSPLFLSATPPSPHDLSFHYGFCNQCSGGSADTRYTCSDRMFKMSHDRVELLVLICTKHSIAVILLSPSDSRLRKKQTKKKPGRSSALAERQNIWVAQQIFFIGVFLMGFYFIDLFF